jgi:hypothetical protein
VDPEKGDAAWAAFGLPKRGGPYVAIHDTANDQQFKLNGKVTKKRLEVFLMRFWEDELEPMKGPADRADDATRKNVRDDL